MAIGISPALPLIYDLNDGPFRLTKSIKQAITQNFKNLVLTNPGERMMDPNFGVGIREYLFELEDDGTQDEISEKIKNQVRQYMSNAIRVLDIRYTRGSSYKGDMVSIENTNSIYVHILFEIFSINSSDVLSISLSG